MTAADQPSANASGRQFVRNAASSYANLIVGILLSLVLTRVLLRHLGTSTYGLWIVLLSIVGYLALLDTGVSTAVVQRVAKLSATGERDEIADVIRTSMVFFSTTGTLTVLVTVAVAPYLSSFLHLGAVSGTVAGETLVILGVMMAARFLNSVPSAVLFGSGRGDRQAQIGGVTLIVTQAAQVAVVLLGGGLVGLAIVSVAGVLFSLVISAGLIRRTTGSTLHHGRFRKDLLVDLLKFGGRNTAIAVGDIAAYALDALVIGLILPVAQVAPYDIALSTANLTRNLTTQGTDMLLPIYSHFETTDDAERQGWVFSKAVMASLAISVPMLIALTAFGEPILKLWLGTIPPQTYKIMIALGLVTALQLPGHQCFVFLTGAGRNHLLVRLSLLGGAFNLIGSIIATYLFGPIGPAIGSLPPVVVIEFFILPAVVCRTVGLSFSRYAREALLPVLPGAIVAGLLSVVIVLAHPISGDATVRNGVQAAVAATVVVIAALVTTLLVQYRVEPQFREPVAARIQRRRS